ncbi:MAG: hypothetical protein Ta2E_11910 [Mycoplasmoidaceae bacterium]|nr:MAG: hypothetical protein Ta2E_11910 [Mycoplasmoidaceae bacterium]
MGSKKGKINKLKNQSVKNKLFNKLNLYLPDFMWLSCYDDEISEDIVKESSEEKLDESDFQPPIFEYNTNETRHCQIDCQIADPKIVYRMKMKLSWNICKR